MALESTDLFVVQRQTGGTPLLKATAAQLNTYVRQTLNDVTLKGNNSEQDITLGTDKITLDATDGSAKFLSGVSGYDSQFLRSNNGNAIYLRGDTNKPQGFYIHGSESDVCFSSNGNEIGSGTGPVVIDSETGNITAAGEIHSDTKLIVGGNPNGGTADGFRADYTGGTKFSRSNGAAPVIECFTTGDLEAKVAINGNGTASFAGNVDVGDSNVVLYANGSGIFKDNLNIRNFSGTDDADWVGLSVSNNLGSNKVRFYGDGSAQFGGTLPLEPNISLNANGSAAFAGSVAIGDGLTEGVYLSSEGRVYSTRVSNDPVWSGYTKDNSTPTSKILADGSATFAGALEAESIDGGTY